MKNSDNLSYQNSKIQQFLHLAVRKDLDLKINLKKIFLDLNIKNFHNFMEKKDEILCDILFFTYKIIKKYYNFL
jgi:hypothetical protein